MGLAQAMQPAANAVGRTNKMCILLTGGSGSGKTDAIGELLKSGYRVGLLSLEGREENIARLRPLIIPIPDRKDLTATLTLLKDPVQRRTAIAALKAAGKTEYDDIDVLALDSLLEYETMLDEELRVEYKAKSGDGSYEKWDQYGVRFGNMCRALRDLTSMKVPEPIHVVATMGTFTEVSKLGKERDVYPIKGNVAPPRIPFFFTYVFRLRTATDEQGRVRFVMDTVGGDGYVAKGPGPGVLPPVVNLTRPGGESFGVLFKKLERVMAGDG